MLNIGDRQRGRVMSKNIFNVPLNKNIIENTLEKILRAKKKIYLNSNPYYKKNSITNISKKVMSLVKIKNTFKYFND